VRIILLAAAILLIAIGGFYFASPPAERGEPEGAVRRERAEERPAPIAAPSFDVVRVDPEGSVVIAGAAAPLAKIEILAMDGSIGSAIADETGAWVVLAERSFRDVAAALRLVMTAPDGATLAGEETVIVAPPKVRGRRPLAILGQPGASSRILQRPGESGAEAEFALSLDVVDYDRAGGLIFTGRARPGSAVRVYANSQLFGEALADAQGRWSMSPAATIVLGTGVYDLQIDQVNAEGLVDAIVETPFERTAVEPIGGEGVQNGVLVRQGNGFWRIGWPVYGGGAQFTLVYEPGAAQPRDPDEVYPQQRARPEKTEGEKTENEETENEEAAEAAPDDAGAADLETPAPPARGAEDL